MLEELSISKNPGYLQGGENASPHPQFNLPQLMATAKRTAGLDVLIGASVYPDPLNNTRNIFGVSLQNNFILRRYFQCFLNVYFYFLLK